jgi:hypothetical protein
MSCYNDETNNVIHRHRPCYPYCDDTGFSTTITLPNLSGTFLSSSVIALLVATVLVYGATRNFNKWNIVLILLTALFIYLILISMSDNLLFLSIPNTVYPFPPHLGHNGVSNEVLGSFGGV